MVSKVKEVLVEIQTWLAAEPVNWGLRHVVTRLRQFSHLAITPFLFLRWLLTDDKATIPSCLRLSSALA